MRAAEQVEGPIARRSKRLRSQVPFQAGRGTAKIVAAAAAALLAFACDREPPERRPGSRDFALEVDDVHARNQALHEKSQELDRRLAELEEDVSSLRGDLATFADEEWAREATQRLDSELEEARTELTEFRAATGADWEALGREAEDAIVELSDAYAEILRDLNQRRSRGGPDEEPVAE